MISSLERRYNQPYEVAKRARGAERKRLLAENKAEAESKRAESALTREARRAAARERTRIRAAKQTRRLTVGRQILRRALVHHAGGECQKCGYSEHISVLEFHHRDPSEKVAEISKLLAAHGKAKVTAETIEAMISEISKCLLLCPTCHRVLHYLERRHPSSRLLIEQGETAFFGATTGQLTTT